LLKVRRRRTETKKAKSSSVRSRLARPVVSHES
jgi:hypothetical protein